MRTHTRIPFLFVFFAVLLGACNVDPEPPEQIYAIDMVAPEMVCGLPQPPITPSSCSGKADGEMCDDGDSCTSGDTCNTGVCRGESRGPFCVRCASDADCCVGIGSITCDGNGGFVWLPTGACTEDGACAMTRRGCLVGESCVVGKGCQ